MADAIEDRHSHFMLCAGWVFANLALGSSSSEMYRQRACPTLSSARDYHSLVEPIELSRTGRKQSDVSCQNQFFLADENWPIQARQTKRLTGFPEEGFLADVVPARLASSEKMNDVRRAAL